MSSSCTNHWLFHQDDLKGIISFGNNSNSTTLLTDSPIRPNLKNPLMDSPSKPNLKNPSASDQSAIKIAALIEILTAVAHQLNLPQTTIAVASTYLYRVVMRCSLVQFDLMMLSLACLYVAIKNEDNLRKIEAVVQALYSVTTNTNPSIIGTAASSLSAPSSAAPSTITAPNNALPEDSDASKDMVNAILQYESIVLLMLCFDLSIDLPHRYIVSWHQEQVIAKRNANVIEQSNDISNTIDKLHECMLDAMAFCNESYRWPFCLLFDARVIAYGCINMAMQHDQSIDLKQSDGQQSNVSVSIPLDIQASVDEFCRLFHLRMQE